MLTQLADLTGDYLVDIAGSDAVCATHLMALLPAPAPTTALWPESNRALDEGDRTSGLTTVPIGVQMFDATWTILTADPLFARTAFGPPFIEQLLAAHQQGTVSRLLFKGNVVHVAVKGRIGNSNHQPFVVYLAHLLPYINPQVWRTPHSSPGPAAPPPSAR